MPDDTPDTANHSSQNGHPLERDQSCETATVALLRRQPHTHAANLGNADEQGGKTTPHSLNMQHALHGVHRHHGKGKPETQERGTYMVAGMGDRRQARWGEYLCHSISHPVETFRGVLLTRKNAWRFSQPYKDTQFHTCSG